MEREGNNITVGKMWRWERDGPHITDVGKVKQAIFKLLQQLDDHACINDLSPLYGQRQQTSFED